MKVTTKIAKNGAQLRYVDGKRVSRETAQYHERENERYQEWLEKVAMERLNAAIDDYAVTVEAQDAAVEAEQATATRDEVAELSDTIEAAKLVTWDTVAARKGSSLSKTFRYIREADGNRKRGKTNALGGDFEFSAKNVAEMQAKFDKAVADSEVDNYSPVEINGETLIFMAGKLNKITAPKLDAEITFRNGRKTFRYRGEAQTKTEFFNRLAERADIKAQIAEVEEFMQAHGGHEITAEDLLQAPFVAQIHPVFKSGEQSRQSGFAGYFETFSEAKRFVDDFKAFAGEMTFAATIKRDS